MVGAVFQEHGFSAARAFVHAHFLARVVPPTSTVLASPSAAQDLAPLLKFTNPSRVLSLSLTQHGLDPLRHALVKESGRLSAHPTFVTGAFSGDVKLGEGFGSSVRMSEHRASEDALRRVYLGGRRNVGLPSDAWAEGEGFKGWSNASGWTEGVSLSPSPSLSLPLSLSRLALSRTQRQVLTPSFVRARSRARVAVSHCNDPRTITPTTRASRPSQQQQQQSQSQCRGGPLVSFASLAPISIYCSARRSSRRPPPRFLLAPARSCSHPRSYPRSCPTLTPTQRAAESA